MAKDSPSLIRFVLERIPHTETYNRLRNALELPFEASPQTAASLLGNGSQTVAADTVPFCLWCAARHPADFGAALWTTVSGFGDRDTTCAIVGGIVALSVGLEGIPPDWLKAREPIQTSNA
jgi:ADP-ribosylglycohydrolase